MNEDLLFTSLDIGPMAKRLSLTTQYDFQEIIAAIGVFQYYAKLDIVTLERKAERILYRAARLNESLYRVAQSMGLPYRE